ncbi:hypothetical protein PsYK624_136710 [Phanerochaete sordida]|uniref:Uncharacterized protein n=1 Tax=Phanerochaete sordida TaxID=48140 RepID=A0A9P3LKP2_9APHY|nr:hypothetical protein PsYK624_136710 [Phanerochaete sordida]
MENKLVGIEWAPIIVFYPRIPSDAVARKVAPPSHDHKDSPTRVEDTCSPLCGTDPANAPHLVKGQFERGVLLVGRTKVRFGAIRPAWTSSAPLKQYLADVPSTCKSPQVVLGRPATHSAGLTSCPAAARICGLAARSPARRPRATPGASSRGRSIPRKAWATRAFIVLQLKGLMEPVHALPGDFAGRRQASVHRVYERGWLPLHECRPLPGADAVPLHGSCDFMSLYLRIEPKVARRLTVSLLCDHSRDTTEHPELGNNVHIHD